jgi:hypothetical protein
MCKNKNTYSVTLPTRPGDSKKSETTKWILRRSSMTMLEGDVPTKYRLDFLLNIRRIVHFAVHAVNDKLKNRSTCLKLWTNALNVFEIAETVVSIGIFEFTLKFEIEPGRVPFQAVVLLRAMSLSPSVDLRNQSELTLISASILDESIQAGCAQGQGPNIPNDKICLCKKEEEEGRRRTMDARKEWNKSDVELISWLPTQSLIVSDYVDFTDRKYFLVSPGKHESSRSRFCSPEIKMLIMISSAPSHFEHRKSIRDTYGNADYLRARHTSLVFLFGTVSNSSLQV